MTNKFVQAAILSAIALAGIVQGLQTYPQYEDNPITNMLENIVTFVFVAEVIVKFLTHIRLPHRFFFDEDCGFDYWNFFDLLVAVLSLMNLRAVGVLRLVRMLRLLKFVRELPMLQMLLYGVIESFSAIISVLLLLTIVMFFFAVLGVFLFGPDNGGEDDEIFNNIGDAFISLFSLAMRGSFSDMMYPRVFDCPDSVYDTWVPVNDQAPCPRFPQNRVKIS